ncbi:MAG: hypothetical protein AB8I08_34325 [Sandaracinaceae bacterium]
MLAEHLLPTQTRLDGALEDLRAACDGADKKTAKKAEKQLSKVQMARAELPAATGVCRRGRSPRCAVDPESLRERQSVTLVFLLEEPS